ncbi:glycoside hydrolase family 18 protein [Amniculicola lignicola CBS 123094]|uniref:chitinase n=1 Tax=Amniculicola lignicola CBS 123094 TaxID=1392246 RepID=A0A6A5WTH0_9PLEO|nr:glycoside hydrolase family 18 protein [Amniculicola lignicola CBS 123094]
MGAPLSFTSILVLILAFTLTTFVQSQQGFSCSQDEPCKVGCCSKSGSCGFGPEWCGNDTCVSTCTAKAECGQYANTTGSECPLNVCCSRWGFCGTTEEFCHETSNKNESCQSNCAQPVRAKCASTWRQRRIAYYESWADDRECDTFRPEDIPIHALTHINIAFGGVGSDFKVTIDDSAIISRVVKLKLRNPALQVFLSLGGWTFSDPGPTREAWSNMAATPASRKTFADSVVQTLETYGLDGIDLDWEYPRADDRGGKPADYDNYVYLLSTIRSAFDKFNPSWDISIAIPASYWYLQHFDVKNMERSVSWFNLMSYDIHGKWDQDNPYTGPYVLGHTNITEIEMGLDLLRRNDIDFSKLSLGTGFYGRTFTLSDPKCNEPGCIFSDAGQKGECSGEAGILTFREIMARTNRLNQKEIRYVNESGVTYMLYDSDQWITYDDEKSFAAKRKLLDEECLGGVMIWAIDQDTQDFKALSALLGDQYVTDALVEGGTMGNEEKEALSGELGGLTGDGCYVTLGCSGPGSNNKFATCDKGDVPIERLHAPGGNPYNVYKSGNLAHEAESCAKGQWKTVCCKAKSPAVNCKWKGAPVRSSMYCDGGNDQATCGDGRYELVTDRFTTYEGGAICASGARSLCCDAAAELQQCKWSGCQDNLNCPEGGYLTYRGNQEGGKACPKGQYQAFCCPIAGIYDDCVWRPDVPAPKKENGITTYSQSSMTQCMSASCPKTQVTIAKATLPERPAGLPAPCGSYSVGMQHKFCCNPVRDVKLPFDVEKIFGKDAKGFDVLYEYKDNYGNNDKDPYGPDETDVGDDPYGFIVLDGDENSLQGKFPRDFAFVHEDDGTGKPIKKRELLSREDPDIMDWTFEHEVSEHLVYCHKGHEENCEKVFIDDAKDTIIALPRHIGSGPFARIVSMEPVEEKHLPVYHMHKRALHRNPSTVYKLVFDYNFAGIKQRADSTVNIRIDYTNLVQYWDTMTGEESDRPANKRDLSAEKRSAEKRWRGPFADWLKKMTTVETGDKGKLPLKLHKKMILYRKRASCARGNIKVKAGLDITLDAKFDMNAQWAYYAQGTIIPLAINEIYTYFAMEPVAEAVLEIEGNAEMEYRMKPEDRIKIIDTLSYPGLAIKGIAAIGPTLDVYGEMRAKATVAGKLRAGAKITFPRYEMYYPQRPEADPYQVFPKVDEKNEEGGKGTDFLPILDATVTAKVGVDILITPEVNLGIKVSTPSIGTILDAQLVGFINNTFRFEVQGTGSGGIGNAPVLTYDIFIKYIYNFGLGGRATFKYLGDWAIKPLQLFPGEGKIKMLYEHHGTVALGKRNPFVSDGEYSEKFDPIWNSTYEFGDEWHASGGSLGVLHKRDAGDAETGLEEAKTSFFNCNDKGKCAEGGCSGDSCEWVPGKKPPGTKARRADDPEEGDPMDVDPVTPCMQSVPVFMYNCKYFPDRDMGGGYVIDGICHNILRYFAANGGGSGPFLGTLNDAGTAGNGNRRYVCGSASRTTWTNVTASGNPETVTTAWDQRCRWESYNFAWQTTRRWWDTAGNDNWFSCDEFPFNALKQGGDPNTNSVSCVPGYQQYIQGNANRVFEQLQQQVSWTDNAGTARTAWKWWAGSHQENGRTASIDWASSSAVGRATAPNRDTAWNWARNNEKHFSFHLFDSDNDPPPTGGSYSIFNHDLSTGDINIVVSALNLLDNPKYRISNFNAYCVVSESGRQHPLWGSFASIEGCLVTFDNGAASAKIKRGEKPTEEEMFRVKDVKIVKGHGFELPDHYTPDDLPPVEVPVSEERENETESETEGLLQSRLRHAMHAKKHFDSHHHRRLQ